MCEQMRSDSSKNIINKMCVEIIYLIYMYKEDLTLNNLPWLICHKNQTKPNQILYIQYICIKRIWPLITHNGWYALKLNQTKFYIFNIYV